MFQKFICKVSCLQLGIKCVLNGGWAPQVTDSYLTLRVPDVLFQVSGNTMFLGKKLHMAGVPKVSLYKKNWTLNHKRSSYLPGLSTTSPACQLPSLWSYLSLCKGFCDLSAPLPHCPPSAPCPVMVLRVLPSTLMLIRITNMWDHERKTHFSYSRGVGKALKGSGRGARKIWP